MQTVVSSYCLDCDWEISAAEYTTTERTAAMIDHAITTDHDIESITQCDEGASTDYKPPSAETDRFSSPSDDLSQ